MSITAHRRPADGTTPGTFGSGGSEPYALALRAGGSGLLYLREGSTESDTAGSNTAGSNTAGSNTAGSNTAGSNSAGSNTAGSNMGGSDTATMDVSRWNARADAADLSLLGSVKGPVLDIGCGPGRMVRASMDLGLSVLGIDVSPAAIALAEESGLLVRECSVFDSLPAEGGWQTALLVDGNIGIGGDVTAMLARCRELLASDGEIVAELHPDPSRDRTYTGHIVDLEGNTSASFPWAEIGLDRVMERALPLGLELRQSWLLADRSFCRLALTVR